MRNSYQKPLITQSGAALIIVLILMIVASTAAVISVNRSTVDVRISNNDRLSKDALMVAEAGVMEAYQLLENHLKDPLVVAALIEDLSLDMQNGGTGINGNALSGFNGFGTGVVTYNGNRYRGNTFNGNRYLVRIVDNVDDASMSVDSDNRVWINAIGFSGTSEREVWAYIKTVNFNPGVFGEDSVSIDSGTVEIDSYSATSGVWDSSSNSRDNAIIGSNTYIDSKGDVSGGFQSGDTYGDIKGTVSGEVEVGTNPISTPSVPDCTDSAAMTAGAFDPAYTGSGGYSDGTGMTDTGGGLSYNSATGNFNAKKTMTLAAGDYCFNNFDVTANGNIQLLGPVRIFVTGNIDLGGGGVTNVIAPSNLIIASSGGDVKIRGGADSSMNLYAPDAKVDLGGNADFSGTMVGKSVLINSSGGIHIDEDSLRDREFKLLGWREVRN